MIPAGALPHASVLLRETVGLLAPAPGRRYLDCTLGAGGHAEALLAAGAEVLGIDRDPAARAIAEKRLAAHAGRVRIRGGTFSVVVSELAAAGEHFHGILADLGLSSMQIDTTDRGFSIKSSARADMRMGDGCEGDAVALIDRLDERELADVLYRYGEERRSYRVAGMLKRARAAGVESAEGLAEAIAKSSGGWQPRHPALRAFQALRIAVNGELDELETLLTALPVLTAPGGTAVVISFHSLEDRLVKHGFRDQAKAALWADHARHPLIPGDDEVAANPRAHSAKLRWARAPEKSHDR